MENSIRSMSATPLIVPEPIADIAGALAALPLFSDLSDAVIKSVCECGARRRYGAGQTVFSAGQFDGGEFFVIRAGRMRVSLVNPETGAMLIEEFSADDVFALEFALSDKVGDSVQRLSATAEEDLTIIAIDSESFRALAGQRPSLMRNIAVHFASALSAQRFRSMSVEAAPEQRVFAALLKFVIRDTTGEWRVPRMPKHRELADAAGVDEADTACAVATLIQEGVARRDYPGLIVTDLDRLTKLAG